MKALAAVAVIVVGVLAGSPAAAIDEPIEARARDHYFEAMTALEALWEYLDAVDPSMRCPVPGSTFVSSFGAPRTGHSHQGVDMMAPFDTPVVAPASGLYVQHGYESFYLHADDGTVYFGTHLGGHLHPGGPVRAGEPVALVSNTGNASGGDPHLHFEIHPGGGSAVDPYPATAAACF